MALLQNQRFPYMKVAVREANGKRGYRRFDGGRLQIDSSDPAYEQVMTFATENPLITIHEDSLRCPVCNEQFVGRTARAQLEIHFADQHPDQDELLDGLRPERTRVKASAPAGLVCDTCNPAQAFGTEEELSAHVVALHTARPELDAEGEVKEPGVRQGVVTTVPAATRKKD